MRFSIQEYKPSTKRAVASNGQQQIQPAFGWEKLELLARRNVMRTTVLKGKSLVLVVAIGMMGVPPALASRVTQAGLFSEVKKAQAALTTASANLKSVEEQIDKEDAVVVSLEKAFDAGEEPEVVLLELEVVAQNLDMIEGTTAHIALDLDVIGRELEDIAKRSRGFKSKKFAKELKKAFDFLEELEKQISSDKKRIASIRGAADQLADAVSSSKVAKGRADLRPVDGSGITAKIKFVDDGTTLMVTGKAKGLDPAESYLSNIYDIGSFPSGPGACVPTIFDSQDPDFILPTMFLGFWEVDQNGNGKLFVTNTNGGADFVPLDKIGTVSIRRFIAPPPAPGAPPETELVACGPRD